MKSNINNRQSNSPKEADKTYKLPNGMSIFHLNSYETDFTYKEIFKEEIYLKHGIRLDKNPCVFDVGANIGLFTLFVKQKFPDATIHAFEPSIDHCRILYLNTTNHGSSVKIHQCGLSNKEGEATFTYYPGYSIISGFQADPETDKETLSSGIVNQLLEEHPEIEVAGDHFIELVLGNKLEGAIQVQCPLRTISSVMLEEGVNRIDLLKIDAEKSELNVLNGIEKKDWPKIAQIVMEAHDLQMADTITSMLKSKGFKIETDQEGQFKETCITNIYATRA